MIINVVFFKEYWAVKCILLFLCYINIILLFVLDGKKKDINKKNSIAKTQKCIHINYLDHF